MIDLGEHKIKNSKMDFFNYYKEDDFGAPFIIEDE